MTETRHARLTKLFGDALAQPAAEREAFLARACAGDDELRAEVADLLARADAPLDLPPIPALPDAESLLDDDDKADADSESAYRPRRIGRYRILRHLGRGGMADVYEAEQDSPRRTVAVKILRTDVSSPSLRRRFELEAQVLGRLRHPGIARIYEAGVATAELGSGAEVELPYFAMEHVRGLPIREYARARGLGVRDRIELAARVCDAVQHAHEQGVVHRDLKPDNILVEDETTAGETPHDARLPIGIGAPKVLDFGVALAFGADFLGSTAHTLSGQLVGTLAYMSPEQAAGRTDQVDARSDVYALGVILYELLSGRLPYSAHGPSIAELALAIREQEPERLGSVVASLRGDVETITAYALEKDPARRYASAAQMATDLRRHLRDEPIFARPPSRVYRAAKFVRRNRALVGGTAAAFLALALGTAVSLTQASEARRSSRTASRLAYRMSLAAASAALRSHRVAEARRLLEQAPSELRGWEWRHLTSLLDESLSTIRLGGARPQRCAMSPDGRLAAIAIQGGGRVSLRSLPEGSERGSFDAGGPVFELDFSSDGSRLFTCALRKAESALSTWDVATLRELSSLGGSFLVAGFDRDAGRVATLDAERHLRVHDLADGRVVSDALLQEPYPSPVSYDRLSRLAYSPATGVVAIAFAEAGGLELRRVSDGALVRRDARGVNSVSFDRAASRLGLGLYEPAALIVDVPTGSERVKLTGHEAGIAAALFSPDERTFATASADGTVRVWDAETGAGRVVYHGHEGRIRELLFTPDGSQLVSAADDSTLRIWDARGRGEASVLAHPHTVYAVAFTPDGRGLVTGCLGGEGTLRIWDASTGALRSAWPLGIVESIAIRADGARMVVGRNQSDTVVLDATTGAVLASTPHHSWSTTSVAFDPVRPRFVSTGIDGLLFLADAETGAVRKTTTLGGASGQPLHRVLYLPDGSTIVASRTDGSIALLDAETLEPRGELRGDAAKTVSIAIDATGSRLAAGSVDGKVRLWDLTTRECLAVLNADERDVFALAFSPDGTRLATGGRDRTIRIWETSTHEELAQLHGHTSFVYALAFSPDGTQLVSGGGDDTARIWDTRSTAERRGAAGR